MQQIIMVRAVFMVATLCGGRTVVKSDISELTTECSNGDAVELRHRLEVSYDIVRSGLTKKLQNSLSPRGE